MIVVMEVDAPDLVVEAVVSYLVRVGADVHRSSGSSRTILGVVGTVTEQSAAVVAEMPGVAKVVRVSEPYRLASRRFRQEPSIVEGAWGAIGGERPWIAVEPVGMSLPGAGDSAPPSLPYAVLAGRPFDAAVVRRGPCPEYVGALACLSLDSASLASPWPVRFVEREPCAGLEEWLVAAEKELARGDRVVLVEPGTPGPGGERSLDVTRLAAAHAATHLPIVVDVPRIAGQRRHAAAVAYAAVAAGATGVILRAWAGSPEGAVAAPVTFTWEAASEVAERIRAIERAVRG